MPRVWALELALQTTLLGLAIAIILALVTALAGPLLIDWGSHRALFEKEASRLIGVDVRVTGAIDARLLPSPQLTLHDIEAGNARDKIHARSLGIEFALGPLMRGQWRASELHLSGLQGSLRLDAAGHIDALSPVVAFDPDGLAIDRLSIEDGKVSFADAASGTHVTLDRLAFNGDARSLLGPFKGEGTVTVGGENYPYRISTGRYGDDGTLKIHLNVNPANRPLSVEADGTFALAGGAPKFDGTLSLWRPVGVTSHGTAEQIRQPWRLSGKLKANAQSALMEQVDFQYGSEERGLSLTGVADFQFGKAPRFTGVLSGHQLDLDRAFASSAAERRRPVAMIREVAELGGGAFRPTIPIQIGIGIDQITLGGSTVQSLRGDISRDASGWTLDRFEFRAPGFTQVRLSGHLAVASDGVTFTGPAEVNAGDPKVLAAWLAGADDIGHSDLRPLNLRGDVKVGSEKIAIEHFAAEFDRKPIAGRISYFFATSNKSAKLDAVITATELDLDTVFGFSNALLAGSTIERPHDLTIAADIGRATFAGFAARNTSMRLKVDSSGLQIERLAVADLGGAAFSASGRFATAALGPQGSMQLDLDASDMTSVMALLARFEPETAQAVASVAPLMAPAKLHARFSTDGAAQVTQARLSIDGSLGKVRLALNGQADVDPVAVSLGNVRIDGRLDADDGRTMVAMLGLDRLVAANAGAGSLSIKVSGPVRGDLHVDGWLIAGGLEANLSGTARPLADVSTAALRATIVKANMAPLRAPSGGRAALPIALTTRVTVAGNDLSFADINATIAGSVVRGRLEYGLVQPHRLRGEIEAEQVDGASLIATAIGMPAQSRIGGNAALAWSSEPFAAGIFGDYAGEVLLKVRRLDLLPPLSARDFRALLRLGKDEFAFADLTGDIAGGQLTGKALFRSADSGLKLNAKLALAGADASRMIAAPAPVTGSLALTAEADGTGLSPVALIRSLHGSGKISLIGAQLASLDPSAFDAVTHAVDQGLPIDTGRISNVASKALDRGPLSVNHADGTLFVSAGQVQLSNVVIDAKDTALKLDGNLDLTNGSVDARLVLTGSSLAAGTRPDIVMTLKGPATAPARSIDVTALNAWLALRAVEIQTRQLREIDIAPHQQSAPPPSTSEPKSERAPALPPPLEIRPAPAPMRSGRPAVSVGPQN